jgi:hypothetical protein
MYTVDEMRYGNNQLTQDNSFTNTSPYVRDRLPQDISFIYDICTKRFDTQHKLGTHRMSEHNSAIDV